MSPDKTLNLEPSVAQRWQRVHENFLSGSITHQYLRVYFHNKSTTSTRNKRAFCPLKTSTAAQSGLKMNGDVISVIYFQSLSTTISLCDLLAESSFGGCAVVRRTGWMNAGRLQDTVSVSKPSGKQPEVRNLFPAASAAEPEPSETSESSLKGLFPESWRTTAADETRWLRS